MPSSCDRVVVVASADHVNAIGLTDGKLHPRLVAECDERFLQSGPDVPSRDSRFVLIDTVGKAPARRGPSGAKVPGGPRFSPRLRGLKIVDNGRGFCNEYLVDMNSATQRLRAG